MSNIVTVKHENLPVTDINLDLANPRIALWMEQYGEPNAEGIALALQTKSNSEDEGGTTFYSLKQSIRTNKGIIHPIIVNRLPDESLVVIEGNTRTMIYRDFLAQGVEGQWDMIPAMVYDNLDDASIDAIRLQAHIVGPRDWDPYSKAKYLNFLNNKQHLTFDQIKDFCGGRTREVRQYIEAYKDMEKYYRESLDSDQDFDPSRFSSFVELHAKKGIVDAIVSNGFSKYDFSKWVHERKLFPQNTVRKLHKILMNEQAREVFLKQGAQEALKVLEAPAADDNLQDATLEQLAREIIRKINVLGYAEIKRFKSGLDSEVRELLFDARDELTELCSDINTEEE